MDKKLKILFFSAGLLTFLIVGIALIEYNPKFTIRNNFGNETDFIVETQNCNKLHPIDEDFYIPIEYQKNGQIYSEKVNETHGYYCWWDPIWKNDLNETYLNENCNQTKKDKFICEKNFSVEV